MRSHLAMRKRRRTILDAFAVESCLLPGHRSEGPLRGPSEDLTVVKIDEGASAISFPSHVPKNIASALRRVHQNMGHPSNEDLARHLRLAGADSQVVKACQQLQCQTCCRSTSTGGRRPTKVVKPLDFNEEVAVDTMDLHTREGAGITVLSMLDVGSGFHLVYPVTGKTGGDYARGFLRAWMAWAGTPTTVLVDQERGLMKDFPAELEKHGINIQYTAGQAHWQNGHVGQQNEWFRQMFDRVKKHISMKGHETNWVLAAVGEAKNYLRRRHGYSPAQWLFGVAPKLGIGLIDGDDDAAERQDLIDPSEEWQRRANIRQAAREAYVQLQATEHLQRALHGRPRVLHGDFQQGQYVYIYRTSKKAGGAGTLPSMCSRTP